MSDDYGNLVGLEKKVTEAAIYAELRTWGFYPDGSGGLYQATGGLGGDSGYRVPGPGQGAYPDDPVPNWIPGADDGYDGPASGVPSIGAIYAKWEARISEVFAKFYGFADPADFDGLVNDVTKALSQLSSGGATTTDDAPPAIDYDGNSTLGLAADVAQKLNDWQGGAATAFATYLNLFTEVVANQATAAELLRICLLMEKEFWVRMRQDVVSLANDAIVAFDGTGGFSGEDLKSVLSVVETVSSIAGWFPLFKPATEVIDKATTVTGLLVDTFAGEPAPTNNLSDAQWSDVYPKLKQASADLISKSGTVEGDIRTALRNLERHISQAPPARTNGTADQENFRLARPSGTFSATQTSDFVFPGVVVNPDNVRSAASQLDLELAPEMKDAGTQLVKSDASSYWFRTHPEIGVGSMGAADDYSAAASLLYTEILETAQEMTWAAEMLRAVAADLEGTDDEVGDDFSGVRGKVGQYDATHAGPRG